MARISNSLFNFLKSAGIFKGWSQTGRASEATELRRAARNRARLVWLAYGLRTDPSTGIKRQIGKGTYIRSQHGNLK